jgi:ABC-type polysaccharide/polyol phosphate transport system ATPase subunit
LQPVVVVEGVWKKFRRGERHDSLRDLLPAITRRALQRPQVSLSEYEFWALRQVTFDVRAGEVVGIIGRNGAGKSTMLKLLTRILRPSRGRCLVRGRTGALIELAAGFHPDLTGRENIFLQGAIMGMTRSEIAHRFDAIVEFSGIGDFIDTQVKRYSSGMNARLGFSIAAFLDPEVLFIDEVLAVGDIAFQQKCYDRLEYFKQQGVATVFVSHNMQAVAALCDRVVYLRANGEPLVGTAADAVTAYLSADGTSGDSRVRVLCAGLYTAEPRGPLNQAVLPGTWLELDVELEALTSLPDCGFGFTVRRSDGLIIFHANSTLEGLDSQTLEPGQRLGCRARFRANLGSGVYTVSVELAHSSRVWANVDVGSAGAFVVENARRWSTVAELEPQFGLSLRPTPTITLPSTQLPEDVKE